MGGATGGCSVGAAMGVASRRHRGGTDGATLGVASRCHRSASPVGAVMKDPGGYVIGLGISDTVGLGVGNAVGLASSSLPPLKYPIGQAQCLSSQNAKCPS